MLATGEEELSPVSQYARSILTHSFSEPIAGKARHPSHPAAQGGAGRPAAGGGGAARTGCIGACEGRLAGKRSSGLELTLSPSEGRAGAHSPVLAMMPGSR